ncbi:hypothetical protein AALF16_04440 [Bacillus cereus]|uniref:hypothetical protein n=1 Tax=Bacillus cereus TaxID=1396 RepID=UPI00356D5013
MTTDPLILSNKEVYVLTGMFDRETMIGIDNPFENWSDEEIDKELDVMYDHWANEELLIIKEDETLCDKQLLEYFRICLTTGFAIEVQINKNNTMEKNVFYFDDKKVIHNRIIDANSEKQCTFKECGTPEVAWQFVYQTLQPKNTFPGSNYTFKIPSSAYKEDLLTQSQKKLLDFLALYLNNEAAAELANIIHNREELNTVQVHYYIKDSWYTDRIQFLYSQNQYWLIQEILDNEQKQTHIICLDTFTIIEEIKKMVLYLKSLGGETR